MAIWNPIEKFTQKVQGNSEDKKGTEKVMEQTTIALDDVLDISVAGQFHEKLKGAFAGDKNIELSAANLQRIDGAGLQLLVAFFKEAEQLHVDVNWRETSDCLLNAAELLGVSEKIRLVS